MPPQLVYQGVDIVLRGNFNPAIFQPRWLAAQGLIRPQEAEAAKLEIIHPAVANFKADWLRLEVTVNRFQAGTVQEAFYETLRDVVIGTFTLLRYTPLEALGINQNFHYRLQSENDWHKVGDELAPKQHWQDLFPNPGMKSLAMEGKRPDGHKGVLLTIVEPSTRVEHGIYVMVNDHYVLPFRLESPASAEAAIAILGEQWDGSMQRASHIAETIVGLGETS